MNTQKDGKTPNLSAEEQQDVDQNQPPRAAVLHEIIRTQGDQELERSVAALWWSALAAGLTMGLSLMAMGLLNSRLPDGEAFKVIASFGYCAGFLAVILARQQLFTENTLTAVLPVMTKPTLGNFGPVAPPVDGGAVRQPLRHVAGGLRHVAPADFRYQDRRGLP